jgi:NAD(P)-dependent dehydrogenase (short-subunit alcohol dehydrogenase family)
VRRSSRCTAEPEPSPALHLLRTRISCASRLKRGALRSIRERGRRYCRTNISGSMVPPFCSRQWGSLGRAFTTRFRINERSIWRRWRDISGRPPLDIYNVSMAPLLRSPESRRCYATAASFIQLTMQSIQLAARGGIDATSLRAQAGGGTSLRRRPHHRSRQQHRSSERLSIPLKRVGDPDEIAGLVAYLASGESGYMTGSSLTIDGGMAL